MWGQILFSFPLLEKCAETLLTARAESSPQSSKFPSVGFFSLKINVILKLRNCKKASERLRDGASILSNPSPLAFPHNGCHPLACQGDERRILAARQLSR